MPAMPIAGSRPPIVVGMRQTSSAQSTVTVTGAAARRLHGVERYGNSVALASRKMIVSPAKRISSAISFGVFWRRAPSTIAIIRSRNVSPGFAVISTTSQ